MITPKEKILLKKIAQGKSNKEIANELSLSVNTVKAELRILFFKLGVKNRTQVAVEVMKKNMNNIRSKKPTVRGQQYVRGQEADISQSG